MMIRLSNLAWSPRLRRWRKQAFLQSDHFFPTSSGKWFPKKPVICLYSVFGGQLKPAPQLKANRERQLAPERDDIDCPPAPSCLANDFPKMTNQTQVFFPTLFIPHNGHPGVPREWPVPFTARLRSERAAEERGAFSVHVRRLYTPTGMTR